MDTRLNEMEVNEQPGEETPGMIKSVNQKLVLFNNQKAD